MLVRALHAFAALLVAIAVTFARPAQADEPAGAPEAADDAPAEGASEPFAAEGENAPAMENAWCASDVETLSDTMCFAAADTASTDLVIFLHGLVKDGSGWQHAQQRGMKAYARAHGFDVLMPKARLGAGPAADMIAWPAKPSKRAEEDEVIADILASRKVVEQKRGAAYARVFVMGFSNGAYYATSLALRGRLDVDGYAVFAGGSGKGFTKSGVTKDRRPMFVAIASKDKTTVKNMKSLDRLLIQLGWPHRTKAHAVGHAVGAVPMREALAYLRKEGEPKKAPETKTVAKRQKPATKKKTPRR